jgi:hypothetical protein
VQPLSVGGYSFPGKPEGVPQKEFERQSALKQVGDPKRNGLVLGRAELSGQSYFDHGPGRLQGQVKGEAGTKLSRAEAAVVGHATTQGFAGARGELHLERHMRRATR